MHLRTAQRTKRFSFHTPLSIRDVTSIAADVRRGDVKGSEVGACGSVWGYGLRYRRRSPSKMLDLRNAAHNDKHYTEAPLLILGAYAAQRLSTDGLPVPRGHHIIHSTLDASSIVAQVSPQYVDAKQNKDLAECFAGVCWKSRS